MKQLGQYSLVLILAAVITFGFKQVDIPDHKYSMTLTQTEWNSVFQVLNSSKEVMRKSSYPGTLIAELTDSLTSIQNRIQSQIGQQIAADTLSKPKK